MIVNTYKSMYKSVKREVSVTFKQYFGCILYVLQETIIIFLCTFIMELSFLNECFKVFKYFPFIVQVTM